MVDDVVFLLMVCTARALPQCYDDGVAERRRLPVIQSAPPGPPPEPAKDEVEDENAPADRPPWHWIGFGTIVTFACWLPLAYVAEAVRHSVFVSRFGASATREDVDLAFSAMNGAERFRWTAMQTLPHVIAFALGAFAGGLLVGRFGSGKTARENQKLAGASGVVTALVAIGVSWRVLAEGGWAAVASMLVPLLLAVGFAWWGGRYATRKLRA
jgi:hypothetical protein